MERAAVRSGVNASPVRAVARLGDAPTGSSTPPRDGGGRALVANAGALVASRYTVAALGWACTVIVVRNLSVAKYGRFAFVFSFLVVVAVFSELEVGRFSVKGLLAPGRDAGRFAGTLLVMRAVMGLVTYGLAVGFIVVAGYPHEVLRATVVGGLTMVIATPSHAVEAVYQAHLRMGTVAFGNVLGQSAQLALTAAVAVAGGSVVLFAVPAVVGEVVIFGWKLVRLNKILRLRPNVDLREWWRLLREALPLAAGTVLFVLYYRVDSVMLSKMDTFRSVGIYAVAYKFVDMVHFLSVALEIPLLSILVRLWPRQPLRFRRICEHSFGVLLVCVGLIATEVLVFARPVVAMLYGGRYAAGANAARVVVIAECLGCFGSLTVTVLVAMGRNRFYPIVTLVGLVLNVALNLFLIPAASYEGAAVATLATNLVVVTILLVALSAKAGFSVVSMRPLRLTLAGSALGAVVGALSWHATIWPVGALAAAMVYLAFVHATRLPGEQGLRSILPEVPTEA